MTIFTLPFVGKNFFRGIVINSELAFGKDAAYELLKGCRFNWQRLLLLLGARLYGFFNRLTDEKPDSVLIVDDSPYDRSRSKMVELLSRVWDHSSGRFLKGFRMLTVCWSDGFSCLPIDFALLSSGDANKRLCESYKSMDSWFTMPATVTALCEHIDVIGMVKKTPKIHYGYNRHQMDLMAMVNGANPRSAEEG